MLCVTAKGKPIKAKTLGQKRYVDAIHKNLVTLGIGPAGTGKTYLAVAAAVAAFRSGEVNILEPKPIRVRNIFICSREVFWASSRMMKESSRVRPRI